MKKYLIGFIAGLITTLSIGVFAVSYNSDIRPLKKAIINIYTRLEIIEAKLSIDPSGRKSVGRDK